MLVLSRGPVGVGPERADTCPQPEPTGCREGVTEGLWLLPWRPAVKSLAKPWVFAPLRPLCSVGEVWVAVGNSARARVFAQEHLCRVCKEPEGRSAPSTELSSDPGVPAALLAAVPRATDRDDCPNKGGACVR